MFEKLSKFEADSLSAQIKQEISEHLRSLEKEFQRYFPDLDQGFATFPRNSFSPVMDIATVPEEVQDELLDLRNDSASREMFMEKSLSQFLCTMLRSYLKLLTEALHVIVPFASTYICETGFSVLAHIKSKARNQLNVEDDMRLAISKTQSRISKLASDIQQQKSHSVYRIKINKKLLHTTFLHERDTCMQFKVYVYNCNYSNLRCNTLQWPRFRLILLLQNKTENNKFYPKTLEGPRLLCRHQKATAKTKRLRITALDH